MNCGDTFVCLYMQWAFGVTCWEIFSLGLQPYPMVSTSEIGDYLKSGQILDKPTLSSDKMCVCKVSLPAAYINHFENA